MYCHLLYVNKQFVINDELLLEKSDQESGPFLIPLVVPLVLLLIVVYQQMIRNGTSASSN